MVAPCQTSQISVQHRVFDCIPVLSFGSSLAHFVKRILQKAETVNHPALKDRLIQNKTHEWSRLKRGLLALIPIIGNIILFAYEMYRLSQVMSEAKSLRHRKILPMEDDHLQTVQQQLEKLQNENRSLISQLVDLEQKLNVQQDQESSENDELQFQLQNLENEKDLQDLHEKIEKLESALLEEQNRTENVRKNVHQLQADYDSVKTHNNALKNQITQLKDSHKAEIKALKYSHQKDLREHTLEKFALESEITKLQQEIFQLHLEEIKAEQEKLKAEFMPKPTASASHN